MLKSLFKNSRKELTKIIITQPVVIASLSSDRLVSILPPFFSARFFKVLYAKLWYRTLFCAFFISFSIGKLMQQKRNPALVSAFKAIICFPFPQNSFTFSNAMSIILLNKTQISRLSAGTFASEPSKVILIFSSAFFCLSLKIASVRSLPVLYKI